MASRQTQAVSTPLLIALLVVALIGAFMLYRNMTSASVDEKVDVPSPPPGFNPKPPANEPGVAGGG